MIGIELLTRNVEAKYEDEYKIGLISEENGSIVLRRRNEIRRGRNVATHHIIIRYKIPTLLS